jgi:hypothetical protein
MQIGGTQGPARLALKYESLGPISASGLIRLSDLVS